MVFYIIITMSLKCYNKTLLYCAKLNQHVTFHFHDVIYVTRRMNVMTFSNDANDVIVMATFSQTWCGGPSANT